MLHRGDRVRLKYSPQVTGEIIDKYYGSVNWIYTVRLDDEGQDGLPHFSTFRHIELERIAYFTFDNAVQEWLKNEI